MAQLGASRGDEQSISATFAAPRGLQTLLAIPANWVNVPKCRSVARIHPTHQPRNDHSSKASFGS